MASRIENPLAVIFLDIEGVFINNLSPRNPTIIDTHIRDIETSCPEYANPSLLSKAEAVYLLMMRATARCLNPKAVKNLKILIGNLSESMRVAIVITSLWRENISAKHLREHVFKDHFFHQYIIDKLPDRNPTCIKQKKCCRFQTAAQKTPSEDCFEKYSFKLTHRKGRLIDYWLRENCESLNIHSFVIIDQVSGHALVSEINARYPNHFVQINSNFLFTINDAKRCFDILNNKFSRMYPDVECVERAKAADERKFQKRLESEILPAYYEAPELYQIS